MSCWPRNITLAFFLFCFCAAFAQERIDSTIVSARRNTSMISPGTGVQSTIRTDLLYKAPSLLGNADPLRFVKMLPGVSTGSELDAGIHVQGTEHQHTFIACEGVPVYGAAHLLGLFSVFIPSHYSSMEYRSDGEIANRLGGSVDMKLPQTVPERATGSLSAGLISSEGSLAVPLGHRSALFASLRRSYINTLYGSFLKLDDNVFEYGFGDANLTFLWKPGEQDLVWFDAYTGNDNLSYDSYENGMDVQLDWHNFTAAAHWKHFGEKGELKQTLYHSRFGLGMDIVHDFFDISMPSGISTSGYKADYRTERLELGADIAIHRAKPQRISASGRSFRQISPDEIQHGTEATFKARYDILDRDFWKLSAAAKAQLWCEGGKVTPFISPGVDALFRLSPSSHITASAGIMRQFLFQTGLSSVALPYEFWLLAGRYSDPQSSVFGRVAYDRSFDGGAWRFGTELYWRSISNQLEYKGSILDFVREDYALDNSLLRGDGSSFGASFVLRKQSGSLTGWAAYTIGRSLRSFDDPSYPDVYPSNHERRHELNVMLTWTSGKWDAGGSFVAADGTPFTSVRSLYVSQDQLVCNFGEHNAARLKPYIRLDLSASYYFRRRGDGDLRNGAEHGLTFSIYNATGRKNDIFYRINLSDDRKFSYRSIYYKIMFLPSLSYFYRF